ncbi:hypothetical protein [Acaricomes phytoseiuli]|uniref:hypothetical protein n=1 Tax=Acaricomes phytoseiuli TaxID=291968 RepID=UPI0012E99F98|nr:hypothetical protein [Acaricomes phytoseiuli]
MEAERSGLWWVLQCVEAPGAITQVNRLEQADIIKEAIAFVAEVPEAEIEIDLKVVLPEQVKVHLDRSKELESSSGALRREAAQEYRAAVGLLREAKVTQADVGVSLGITQQRVAQIEKENTQAQERHRGAGLRSDLGAVAS